MKNWLMCGGAALLLAAAGQGAEAATLRVGADSSCDYVDVSTAIASAQLGGGPTVIRLARNTRHVLRDPVPLVSGIEIQGGYSSCFDQSPLGTTTLVVPDVAEFERASALELRRHGIRLQPATTGDVVADVRHH